MERRITLLLHVGPIHKKSLSDGILPVLGHGEVPISLEVIQKPRIMKLDGQFIGVFMSVDHGLIFSPCEVHRSARVMTIHSSKGVLIISLKWKLNLLNYVTRSCFSDSMALDHICSFLITLGGTCITSPSSFFLLPSLGEEQSQNHLLGLSYRQRSGHHEMSNGLQLS
jgi:hypothetical protein